MENTNKTFLDTVAEQIVASTEALNKVKIIVPSTRSIRFLKEAFNRILDRPVFAPTIINVEHFLEKLSGLQRIQGLALFFDFYNIYKSHTPEDEVESFEQFLSWAPGLIQEFSDLDAYLTESQALFEYLVAFEKIKQWGTETPLMKNYIVFNQRLPSYYKALYELLLNKKKGYAGMQFREAVDNLNFYTTSNESHHFFVGFNALNRAEESIIHEMVSLEQATVIWDIDSYFFNDSYHISGQFIRKYHNTWPSLRRRSKPKFPSNFEKEKRIEIIGCAKNIPQAKYVSQILKALHKKESKAATAVILGQESLLIPTISGIDTLDLDWNVTMGYPLKETAAASFFKLFYELHLGMHDGHYEFSRVSSLLECCSSHRLFGKEKYELQALLKQYRIRNQNLIRPEKFMALSQPGGIAALLFEPFTEPNTFIGRMIAICEKAFTHFHAFKSHDFKLLAVFFVRFKTVFQQLQHFNTQYPFVKGLSELKTLFYSLLESETVDFLGEPTRGIQVMGLLETRLLDFENVIITHVNEGMLPAGKGIPQFIPHEVKRKFDLPTFIEQDAIFSYHFFRVLQRAKNIFLLYNATTEGLFAGEKSRFLYQLEFFAPEKHHLTFRQLHTHYAETEQKKRKVEKSETILEALRIIADKGFSPSSLTQYIRNPYAFYEQRILGIKPPQTLESTMNAMDKGTVMHNALETLYKPFLNRQMKVGDYDQMLVNYESILTKEYNEVYHGDAEKRGFNYMLFEMMKALIQNFLNRERQAVAAGHRLKILALEEKFDTVLEIPALDFPVQLRGTVDRIDLLNDTLRIIDYKTGAVKAADLKIEQWEELTAHPEKSALVQVLIYAYVYREKYTEFPLYQAGVISFRNFENDFFPFSIKKNRKSYPVHLNAEHFSTFETVLFELVASIFDPVVPFEEPDET